MEHETNENIIFSSEKVYSSTNVWKQKSDAKSFKLKRAKPKFNDPKSGEKKSEMKKFHNLFALLFRHKLVTSRKLAVCLQT